MDNEKDLLDLDMDFDLEDILKEFSDTPTSPEAPAETPAEESPAPKEVSQPEPVAEATPEPSQEPDSQLEPAAEESVPVSEDATVRFDPVEPESAGKAGSAQDPSGEAPVVSASLEDTIIAEPAAEEAPKVAEPAFPVEEVFIPSPSVFTPRSRLRELKKKLVAGPEKRYYALSEQGVGKLQIAILVCLGLVALCAAMTSLFSIGQLPASRLRLVIFTQVLAMMVSGLMGCQLMLDAFVSLFKGKFTMDTLVLITFIVCLLDGALCLKELRIPCCAAFSLEMAMALWARYQRHTAEMGQMDTMRKAVRLHGVVKTPNFYEGKGGLLQVEGEVEDFMDTYDKTPTPVKIQNGYALVSLMACIGIAALAGMRHSMSMALQILSASLLVAVPASFFVSLTRPMAILEARLHMVGSVICGWNGVKHLSKKAVFPLNDEDLFPQGSTKLNGVKFYGGRDPVEVVSFTTSLITKAGGCLAPVFQKLLASREGRLYPVENFRDYGGGGIGCEIHGEPVLVGTLDFLQDMGIDIPEGTMVNQAVYAAIDGQLSAVYAISYAKMRSAAAGLVTLNGCRNLTPLILCQDFMVTEEFLQAKFGVKTKRMLFPDGILRTELKKLQPDPECSVLALSTREELVGTAYAVTGSRALRTATTLGLVIHLLGGILGICIMLALGYLGSTELLTPTNVLLYQLVWALPGLLITERTRTV